MQRGTHEELLKLPGHYQEVYDLQLRPQEVDINGSKLAGNGAHAAIVSPKGKEAER